MKKIPPLSVKSAENNKKQNLFFTHLFDIKKTKFL